MTLFDAYLMVDWSAASSPKTGKDSIWWALVSRNQPLRSGNPSTRARAFAEIRNLLIAEIAAGRRVLCGFDFPFGYPRGAIERLAGSSGWRAMWSHLSSRISDEDDNGNNRYQVAAELNSSLDAAPRFWGHPHHHAGRYAGLLPTSPKTESGVIPLRRRTEAAPFAKAAKTVWQLSGAGSVGSQALLGIPFLERLCCEPALRHAITVWPFETGLAAPAKPICVAEVYPSLIQPDLREVGPHDRRQVATLARWFADWDEAGTLADAFTLPEVSEPETRLAIAAEEGFILGLGCDTPPKVLS